MLTTILAWCESHRRLVYEVACAVVAVILLVWVGLPAWSAKQDLERMEADAKAYTEKQLQRDTERAAVVKQNAAEIASLTAERDASLSTATRAQSQLAAAKSREEAARKRADELASLQTVLLGQVDQLSKALLAAKDTSHVKDSDLVVAIRVELGRRLARPR